MWLLPKSATIFTVRAQWEDLMRVAESLVEFSDNTGHPAHQTDSVDLQHALVAGVVGPGGPGPAGPVVSPHIQPSLKTSLA